MKPWLFILVGLVSLALPAALCAQTSEELTAQDLRLAAISDAMLVANAHLCRDTMPVTGMILHSADQYGAEVQSLFESGPLAISAVVPGSPAATARLLGGDIITAINGASVDSLVPEGDEQLRETAFFVLAEYPEGEPIVLQIDRAGQPQAVSFRSPRGCRSLVEIRVADGPDAQSNGRIIQLQYDFAASLSDQQLAVALAHELAHSVLEHRRRKEAEGIDNGSVMRHVGQNQQVNRKAEVEADRLSVHLMANAGYDPAIIAQFWRSPEGIRAGGGSMPSWVYPSQGARADIVSREIAMYLPLRQGPTWPGHLIEQRDRPLSGD